MQPTWFREVRPGRRPVVRVEFSRARPGRLLAIACWCGLMLTWVWGANLVRLAERPPILVVPGAAERHVSLRPGRASLRLVVQNAAPVAVRILGVRVTAGPGVVPGEPLVGAAGTHESAARTALPAAGRNDGAPRAVGSATDAADATVAVRAGGVDAPAEPLGPGGATLRPGRTAVLWVPLELAPGEVHVISRVGLDLRVLGLEFHQVLREFGYVQIATE